MIGAEVAARGFAFAAAMLLFGAALFLVYAPHDAFRLSGDSGTDRPRGLRRAVLRMQMACVAAAIVASAMWLVIRAAVIGGESIAGAAASGTLARVMEETLFGRMATYRLGLMVLLGALLLRSWHAREATGRTRDIVGAALGAALLAAMAWMGHAVATAGSIGRVHLGADVIHLLAAGAWIGGLPPLALTLRAAAAGALPVGLAAETIHRFSRLGMLCVGALILTGAINAWLLVESPAALFGSRYGQLLLLKLVLFVVMLVLAGRNRFRWTREIVASSSSADVGRSSAPLGHLAQNARLEAVLGLAIALVVGALGVVGPAAHAPMAEPSSPADMHRH